MTDQPQAPGKPGAVRTVENRPMPGAKPPAAAPGRPRGIIGGVMARDRPGALPMPATRSVSAFTPSSVIDAPQTAGAAGLRPAALAGGDNVITMFDDIGEGFWTSGITARGVAAQLRAIGDRPVEVQINSPGGDMFEGIAIYNVLREHPQPITVKVLGVAASAASIIAMAADTLQIGAASFLMIHNCWVVAAGNRHDMAETAAFLEPFDQAMVGLYAARSGQDAKLIAKWMDDETFMSGQLAIDRGFADALLPADQVKVDENAQAADRRTNDVRSTERALMSSGLTRTQARARLHALKGTPDAALDPADTPDAGGDLELTAIFGGLLTTLKS
jgi:ATP-dependent protease ClpP protease subunit